MLNDKLSKSDCSILAKKIRENIFKPSISYKTSIFLCGADIRKKETTRFKIAQSLTENFWYSMHYDLIYPEDIFDELLYSANATDLLSLENLLADSVDVVIIIPESAGSFAELGAFANNQRLRHKLICVMDVKYKKDKSFINQGPVKLIKSVNKDAIVYIDESKIGKTDASKIESFFLLSKDPEIEKILSAVRKTKKVSVKVDDRINLLQLDKFLLPTIFLLEPVGKPAIEDAFNSPSSTITALTMLTKKRFVESTSDGYKLTQLGKNEFLSFRNKSSRYKQQDKTVAIDDLRIEILNLKYRTKKLKV
jgi:hypothetical protein